MAVKAQHSNKVPLSVVCEVLILLLRRNFLRFGFFAKSVRHHVRASVAKSTLRIKVKQVVASTPP